MIKKIIYYSVIFTLFILLILFSLLKVDDMLIGLYFIFLIAFIVKLVLLNSNGKYEFIDHNIKVKNIKNVDIKTLYENIEDINTEFDNISLKKIDFIKDKAIILDSDNRNCFCIIYLKNKNVFISISNDKSILGKKKVNKSSKDNLAREEIQYIVEKVKDVVGYDDGIKEFFIRKSSKLDAYLKRFNKNGNIYLVMIISLLFDFITLYILMDYISEFVFGLSMMIFIPMIIFLVYLRKLKLKNKV